jgi:hypothetical protein
VPSTVNSRAGGPASSFSISAVPDTAWRALRAREETVSEGCEVPPLVTDLRHVAVLARVRQMKEGSVRLAAQRVALHLDPSPSLHSPGPDRGWSCASCGTGLHAGSLRAAQGAAGARNTACLRFIWGYMRNRPSTRKGQRAKRGRRTQKAARPSAWELGRLRRVFGAWPWPWPRSFWFWRRVIRESEMGWLHVPSARGWSPSASYHCRPSSWR